MWLGDKGDGVHDGGPDDPRVAIIKISSETLVYNISKKNLISTVVESVQGYLNSEPPSINKLVHLGSDELQKLRSASA